MLSSMQKLKLTISIITIIIASALIFYYRGTLIPVNDDQKEELAFYYGNIVWGGALLITSLYIRNAARFLAKNNKMV